MKPLDGVFGSTAELMRLTFEISVPIRIQELKQRNGPTSWDLSRAREFGQLLGEKGDILLFPSKKKGETARMMGEMINAIAVAAFIPGGITFLGQHWEA